MSDAQAMDTSSTTDHPAEAATDLTSVEGVETVGPALVEPGADEISEVSDITEEGTRDLTVDDAQGDSNRAGNAVGGAEDADGDTGGADDESGPRKKSRVRQLEREGEVAADFLETLLDIADLDGDIDVDVDGDRAAIAIVDSEEGRVPRRLVGADGKVLEALQELTRLAVQVETGERSRLMLDVAGYRAERRSALVVLAKQSIAQVRESGSKMSLEPMSAFERKVVHDEVSAAGLVSESEGVDPHRHIVILPA
ncbi:MAG: RNA-binding protein [Humibacillus sp.]|nr:RNA-binding protein [Humibacillus sp.]MDN5778416.1 RNA-binding protein [Humibacillus sp.]